MLLFCYSKYGTGIPQNLFNAILPFLEVAFVSIIVAPVYALFLRLALRIAREEKVEFHFWAGYMTSVALTSLWIVCGWLGSGWVVWPFLAAIVLTTLYTVMLELPPQRAMLPALIMTVGPVVLWGLVTLLFFPEYWSKFA